MPVIRDFDDELSTSAKLAARIRLVEMRRNFECAGRVVFVILSALRSADGQPIWNVVWQPDQPTRLSLQDIADFDKGKRWAVAEILRELERRR